MWKFGFGILLIILLLLGGLYFSAPNRVFGLEYVVPEYNESIFSATKQKVEEYKVTNGRYPESLDSLIPSHLSKLLKSSCNEDVKYMNPGIHNAKGYDLWLEPCKPYEEQGYSNW